jgi:hypothetical protein
LKRSYSAKLAILISSLSKVGIPTASLISPQSSSVTASEVKHLIRGRFFAKISILPLNSYETAATSG